MKLRSQARTGTQKLQRECSCGGAKQGGECEKCKRKRLQRSSTLASQGSLAPLVVQRVLRAPGKPLDAGVRAELEPRLGHDLSAIRIHTDSTAQTSAEAVGAHAYTVGRDIIFARDRYAPATREGRQLLAHELTHSVQQGLRPAAGSAIRIDDDATAESEAERVGKTLAQPSAWRGEPTRALPVGISRRSDPALQRRKNCDIAEVTLPFSFSFTMTRGLPSRSFRVPTGVTTLNLEAEADYTIPPPSSRGDFCVAIYECGFINTHEGQHCFSIDGTTHTATFTGLNDGELHYLEIWKGKQDGLEAVGSGTISV